MKEYLLVDGQSAASSITSVPVDLGDLRNFCLHAVFSGSSLAGNFYIEGSIENGNFTQIPQSITPITSGDDVLMPVENGNYRWVRSVWAPVSGSGTLTLRLIIKENVVKGM